MYVLMVNRQFIPFSTLNLAGYGIRILPMKGGRSFRNRRECRNEYLLIGKTALEVAI
jgi:hypothetical protein